MAASTASASTDPPYYILIAHSQSLDNPSVPTSTSFSHPVIEYHYADDAPNSLLPQPGEHVLVLDYDPGRPGPPTVKSLSADLAVSAVNVANGRWAPLPGEQAVPNNSMYVIETMPKPVDNRAAETDEQHVHAVLAQFKQRNAILRRILDYPNTNGASHLNGVPTVNGNAHDASSSPTPQT